MVSSALFLSGRGAFGGWGLCLLLVHPACEFVYVFLHFADRREDIGNAGSVLGR